MHALSIASLLLLALLSASPCFAADPLASYYGNYISTASDVQACKQMSNGVCQGRCCATNFTLQQTSTTPQLQLWYDPSTLSRCSGGVAGPYFAALTMSTDGNNNPVGTGSVSLQPLVITFLGGDTFSAVFGNTGPQCIIRASEVTPTSPPASPSSTSSATPRGASLALAFAVALLVALLA
jgi:hypothetical protein